MKEFISETMIKYVRNFSVKLRKKIFYKIWRRTGRYRDRYVSI